MISPGLLNDTAYKGSGPASTSSGLRLGEMGSSIDLLSMTTNDRRAMIPSQDKQMVGDEAGSGVLVPTATYLPDVPTLSGSFRHITLCGLDRRDTVSRLCRKCGRRNGFEVQEVWGRR